MNRAKEVNKIVLLTILPVAMLVWLLASGEQGFAAGLKDSYDNIPGLILSGGAIDAGSGGAITSPPGIVTGSGIVEIPVPTPPSGPPRVIRKADTRSKVICLTFDDAGSPAHVRKIMDVLEHYQVKGTFFVLGSFAARNPEVMREMLQRGHEVANHSYNHKNYKKLSTAAIVNDMKKADQAFFDATGQSFAPYLRPPYGSYDKNTLAAMQQLGYSRLVLWSVDTLDWKVKSPAAMMNYVKKQSAPGGIVLMHLLDKKPTVSALPQLITWLKDNGYEILTLTEMLYIEQQTEI